MKRKFKDFFLWLDQKGQAPFWLLRLILLGEVLVSHVRLAIFKIVTGLPVLSDPFRNKVIRSPASQGLVIVGSGPSCESGLAFFEESIGDRDVFLINSSRQIPAARVINFREKSLMDGRPLVSAAPDQLVLHLIPGFRHFARYKSAFTSLKNVCFYTTLDFPAATPTTLARLFLYSTSVTTIRRISPGVIPGVQSTLLRAVWLGFSAGYSEISYVGIDLKDHDGTPHRTAIMKSKYEIPIQLALDGILSAAKHSEIPSQKIDGSESRFAQFLNEVVPSMKVQEMQ